MPFADRSEAGRQLAKALDGYQGKDAVVLALPRGGVPVAAEVAAHLEIPLDLLLVRKIGVPAQPELAMGAVIDGASPIVVRNEGIIRRAWVSADEFERASRVELAEIERRRLRYLGDRRSVDIEGRIAIVVDDGIATGATMRAAIQGLRRRHPSKIILAVPVAPPETVGVLRKYADHVICLEEPDFFQAIGFYYRDFRQLSDQDVIACLDASRSTMPAHISAKAK
ncbi:MAG: phosphoribosyltransferase [Phyllobacterium sp.]|uniref:phosphoribosyltransferase n=1 Tax=Phyllobacterium sp. TaxID=1871046 RepID=UPI0030F293E5